MKGQVVGVAKNVWIKTYRQGVEREVGEEGGGERAKGRGREGGSSGERGGGRETLCVREREGGRGENKLAKES